MPAKYYRTVGGKIVEEIPQYEPDCIAVWDIVPHDDAKNKRAEREPVAVSAMAIAAKIRSGE